MRSFTRRFRSGLRILLLAVATGIAGVSAPASGASLEPVAAVELTSVAQIVQLNRNNWRSGIAARVTGRITYVDGLRSLFLQDGTGGVLVQNPNVEVELRRGQTIEVDGEVTRGGAAPAITGLRVRIIDASSQPLSPLQATGEIFQSTSFEYRFVELTGLVRAAAEDRELYGRAQLKLACFGREVAMSIRDIGTDDYHRLEDATIRVRGVLRVYVDATGVPVNFKLATQSIEDVTIVEPAPRLSDIPLVSAARLPEGLHRVRLHGAVRLGGAGLVLQDSSGIIGLIPSEESDIGPASEEDVVGFSADMRGVKVLAHARRLREGLARDNATGGPRSSSEAILTTVAQIRQLSERDLQRNRKVSLRGVVTYSDPSVRDTFIQDATGGIFVFAPTGGKLDLRPGQFVELEGLASVGGFAPVITEPTIKVVGEGALPRPLAMDMEQLLTGKADSQMVEARGAVRSVRPEAGHLRLELVWGSHRYLASVAGITQIPPWLAHARVRLTGVCGAMTNFRHQILGIEINVPDLSYIRPVGQEKSDDLPLRRIEQVLRYSGDAKPDDRARIQGKVVFTSASGPTYLSDFSGGILIKTHSAVRLSTGDWVEAVGTPRTGAFAPFLVDAQLVKLASLDAPRAKATIYDEILDGGFEAELVQIEGYLVSDGNATGEQSLLLQAGDRIFEARLMRGRLPALTKGSLLSVTGLTSLHVDEAAQVVEPIGFSILLRSPDDVQVVRTAPWLSEQRLQNAGWAALAVVLVATAWIFILRRQVGQRTQELRLANEVLKQLSCQDSLTGAANRRKFDETLSAEYARAGQSSSKLALLMVDIDYFKALNDHYGHQRGDECLIQVVRALQSVPLRANDILARYGGEEFAVILSDTDVQGALAVAERMRIAVRELAFPHAKSPFDQTVSISIGAGVMEPRPQTAETMLIRIADQALYRSKLKGRNRITAVDEKHREREMEVCSPV